jgi:hypothetical protein
MKSKIEDIRDYIEENKAFKSIVYVGSGILLIWILGKASLLLADASNNFKKLFKSFNND